MTDKKLAAKRIILFVLFTYGLYWIFAGLCDLFGILQGDAGYFLTTALAMFTPAAGSLLTRLVTREGMANSFLRLNFKGNAKYYLMGIFVPIVYSVITLLILALSGTGINGDVLDTAGVSSVGYTAAVVSNIFISAAMFPVYLGEELGWRGYLFPKLKTVMPKPAAHILCGLIWGVWHTPAVIDGLNFGKDYAGYPYLGVLLMCLFCIGAGIIFTWLTEKTGSVYPAVLAHSVNNNAAPLITAFGAGESIVGNFAANIGGVFAVALLCIVLNIISGRKALSDNKPFAG